MFTECSKVNTIFSIYRVTLYLPSSKLHCVISMDRASTSIEGMTMSSNVVDTKNQKVTESAYRTWVVFYWADLLMFFSLVFLANLVFVWIGMIYICVMYCIKKKIVWSNKCMKYCKKCMRMCINNSTRNLARSIQKQKRFIYHIRWSVLQGSNQQSSCKLDLLFHPNRWIRFKIV